MDILYEMKKFVIYCEDQPFLGCQSSYSWLGWALKSVSWNKLLYNLQT